MPEVHNGQDILDSRDIIARIDEIESQLAGIAGPLEPSQDLKNLKALVDEAVSYSSDWQDGAALIRGTYFVEYAEELADDIGAIDRNLGWPMMHIDWEAAAQDLKQDYTAVDFAGVEYWVR